MIPAQRQSDCAAFGCVGLPWCDYCGKQVDSLDARAVLTAAARLRAGDVLGALRLLTVRATA